MTALDLPAPEGYEPRAGMGLTADGASGSQRWEAACQIAANRASKISSLHANEQVEIAARYQADLHVDVDTFLLENPGAPTGFDLRLRHAATPRDESCSEPGRFQRGDVVEIDGAVVGTISHAHVRHGVRSYAITVRRTASPPHPRHGDAWTEQWQALESRIRTAAEAPDYPYGSLPHDRDS